MASVKTVPMSQVELSIVCRNLRDKDIFSKSDPMVVVFMKNVLTQQYKEIQRTEVLMNTLNPEFARKILVDYNFEQSQKMKFEVYDVDSNNPALSAHDFLGQLECTLGEIVGSRKIHKPLCGKSGNGKKNYGSILIAAEELETSKVEVAHLQFQAAKLDKMIFCLCCSGTSNPFLNIYRINDDQTQTLAHRTEEVELNVNPVWKVFSVRMRQLCNCNKESPIKIECCFHYEGNGNHKSIGETQVTFTELTKSAMGASSFELKNQKKIGKKGYKNSGLLLLKQCNVEINYSFLDYILAGTQIHFIVAIDFTASNGDPSQPSSLHHVDPFQPNQYMMALRAVGDICQDYSTDKLFPAFGFGAQLPNAEVSHEFHLNFQQDPRCLGVDGVLEAYQLAIRSVTLHGPTNFAPVITKAARIASDSGLDGSHYFVLLIVTDGIITDFEETKAAIVQASDLPMSMIIVGVGNADFTEMRDLDSDNQLIRSGAMVAKRDIVQFVSFENFIGRGGAELRQYDLAKEVLYEIPGQLTGWMKSHNLCPKPLIHVSLKDPQIQQPQTSNPKPTAPPLEK